MVFTLCYVFVKIIIMDKKQKMWDIDLKNRDSKKITEEEKHFFNENLNWMIYEMRIIHSSMLYYRGEKSSKYSKRLEEAKKNHAHWLWTDKIE